MKVIQDMMTSIARRLAALLAFFAFALPASATSTGIDYTDIWWNPNESGWGINLMEQGTTIFATMFVYDASGHPTWYTGQMTSGGTTSFTGPVYATTGPYWGANGFDPNAVGHTQVGTMTVNFSNGYTGALSYTINGVIVNKNIVRQSFANNNMAGTYMGGLAASGTNCNSGITNGPIFMNGSITVTQNGQNLSMATSFFNNGTGTQIVCTFTGVLQAQGSLGQVAGGAWSCNGANNTGSFNLDNTTMTQNGFSGIFSGKDQYCTYNGWFGGIKMPS